jgi:hypothetical protein
MGSIWRPTYIRSPLPDKIREYLSSIVMSIADNF